jgi:hypothetical protein
MYNHFLAISCSIPYGLNRERRVFNEGPQISPNLSALVLVDTLMPKIVPGSDPRTAQGLLSWP